MTRVMVSAVCDATTHGMDDPGHKLWLTSVANMVICSGVRLSADDSSSGSDSGEVAPGTCGRGDGDGDAGDGDAEALAGLLLGLRLTLGLALADGD